MAYISKVFLLSSQDNGTLIFFFVTFFLEERDKKKKMNSLSLYCHSYTFFVYSIKNQVARKVALTLEGLQECIDNLRGATMIAYPMGLPSFDTAQQCLDGIEDLAGTQVYIFFGLKNFNLLLESFFFPTPPPKKIKLFISILCVML